MNITNPHAVPALPSLSEIESPERPATLDAILKQTLADPVDFAQSEKLIALQTELSDYSIYVSLASTLARKAVSAVETLVKAQ